MDPRVRRYRGRRTNVGEAAAWSGDDAEVTGGRPTGEDEPVRFAGVAGGPMAGGPGGAATASSDAAGAEADGDGGRAAEGAEGDGGTQGADGSGARPRRSLLSALRSSWPPQQWPLVIVLSGVVLSLVVVAVDDFRPGTVLFSGSLLLGALLRLVLPDRQAGLLVLRSRAIDVLLMLIMGLSVLLLSLLIPDLPAGGLPAIQQ